MSTPNRSPVWIVWAGVILLLGVTTWFGWKALRDAKPREQDGAAGGGFPPSTVVYQLVEEREVAETIRVTGSLRAMRRAEVAARESAAVESLEVNEGDLVERDAILATLDGRRLEAQRLEAEAALTAAQAELSQREAEHLRAAQDEAMMRDLWNDRAVAERLYLDSVRELKVAAAREEASRKSIEAATKRRDLLDVRTSDLEVRAPFPGLVVAHHTELGEWLREGDPVVTLISTGELEAWLQLPERQAAALTKSLPRSVEIRVSGGNGPIRSTELSVIPDVEGRARRFSLVARLTDPDNTLTPGVSVEAEVPLGDPAPHLVVSSDAILRSYAGTYVMVPAPSESGPPLARRVPVTVRFERGGEAFLAPGPLKVGDKVIVEGNERLFPNSPVDPHPIESIPERDAGRAPGASPPPTSPSGKEDAS